MTTDIDNAKNWNSGNVDIRMLNIKDKDGLK